VSEKPETVFLSPSERLRESKRQATSMSLPLAVHHRLELLARSAADVEATRAEIIGVLIASAGLDAEGLEQAVLQYRKLTVGDVLPDEPAPRSDPAERPVTGENVISIARPTPGRPSRGREAG
jgi:hypothetical protein